ncbi:YmfK family protein [Ferviditalea candida]|uniref:YmfK family protein n=1 Tax=Ferviditalea candida TaxID=3108399 RepID=A0ABU5ZJH5_9BACL|nr:YmfK family protein [Paenibacillaceae bacterium T2]
MEGKQWYLEYKIHKNRPGLLGDIASLMGMLNINILTINGVEDRTRGMLIQSDDDETIQLMGEMMKKVENITITALRAPKLVDILAVRHGRYIERDSDDKKTFRFSRDELGLLVDFLGEVFKREGNQVIGLRGMPRVGKTESIIAGSVSANKRWTFLSSTMLRQTVRTQLSDDEMSPNNIFIIDGIVSTMRSNEKHFVLLQQIMRMPTTKVIEHPDIFIRESEYDHNDFNIFIELRNSPEEEINYDAFTNNMEEF